MTLRRSIFFLYLSFSFFLSVCLSFCVALCTVHGKTTMLYWMLKIKFERGFEEDKKVKENHAAVLCNTEMI